MSNNIQGVKPGKKALNISRKKADQILSEVVERAKEINASPYPKFMHFVTKIAVFGSYLTDKEKLGDVDIAVLFERREESVGEHFPEHARECIEIHKKNVSDWMQMMFFPDKIVRQTLQNRSKSLSIHSYDELDRMVRDWNTPHQVIYQKD
jgi:predicted nucleotidyltransferase